MEQPSKIELFFVGLFPNLILNNNIISTIVYNVGLEFKKFKTKLDNTLNTDI